MDKMNTEEIAKINEAYAIIADIPALYERAWVTLANLFAFENDYSNPLFTYKESSEVSELRTHLIKFVITETIKNVNYEVDEHAIHNHVDATLGKLGFDAQVLVDFITEHYESRADELSLKAIKAKVRVLKPRFMEDYEERTPVLTDLVKKDTLTLRCFLNWTYHWDYGRFIPLINAFEQYVRIEMSNEKPSIVKAWQISQAYTYEESGLGVHKLGNGISDIFESVQVYKNGTLRIRFKSREYAEQIGKAFIRDFYTEGSDEC